jgi:hypothetical protein
VNYKLQVSRSSSRFNLLWNRQKRYQWSGYNYLTVSEVLVGVITFLVSYLVSPDHWLVRFPEDIGSDDRLQTIHSWNPMDICLSSKNRSSLGRQIHFLLAVHVSTSRPRITKISIAALKRKGWPWSSESFSEFNRQSSNFQHSHSLLSSLGM